jgi:cadmium resistance transport/sequestration family protein
MEVLITSIIAFAFTNIDDIFLLMLYFGNRQFKSRDIITGQYIGIITLILLSITGSLVSLFITKFYVGLLGVIPVYLGIKDLIKLFRRNNQQQTEPYLSNKSSPILTVASVTFANGADNIGVYVPLFAVQTPAQKVGTIIIFLIMVALWCIVAKYISRHPVVASFIDKYGHIITPFVFIGIGLLIMIENDVFKAIL